MGLSTNQIRAAQLSAKGVQDKEIYPKIGISEATFYRWKKSKSWQDCLLIFQQAELEKATALALTADEPDLKTSRDDELYIREKLRVMIDGLCELALTAIEARKEDAQDLPIRQIPSLVSSVTDVVKSLRDGNDRITSLEALLDELGTLEKEIQKKVVSIAPASKSTAA